MGGLFLGITEINLRPDVTSITLPDGSQITGQMTFKMNGADHIAANATLAIKKRTLREHNFYLALAVAQVDVCGSYDLDDEVIVALKRNLFSYCATT